jgi:hypothetical protein
MKPLSIALIALFVVCLATYVVRSSAHSAPERPAVDAISQVEWERICEDFVDFEDPRQLLGAPIKSPELLLVLREENINPEAFRQAGAIALSNALSEPPPEETYFTSVLDRPEGDRVSVTLEEDTVHTASAENALAARLLNGVSRSCKGL